MLSFLLYFDKLNWLCKKWEAGIQLGSYYNSQVKGNKDLDKGSVWKCKGNTGLRGGFHRPGEPGIWQEVKGEDKRDTEESFTVKCIVQG